MWPDDDGLSAELRALMDRYYVATTERHRLIGELRKMMHYRPPQ